MKKLVMSFKHIKYGMKVDLFARIVILQGFILPKTEAIRQRKKTFLLTVEQKKLVA